VSTAEIKNASTRTGRSLRITSSFIGSNDAPPSTYAFKC